MITKSAEYKFLHIIYLTLLFFSLFSMRVILTDTDYWVAYYGFPFPWYGVDGAGSLNMSISIGRLFANLLLFFVVSFCIYPAARRYFFKNLLAKRLVIIFSVILNLPVILIFLLANNYYFWSFPSETLRSNIDKEYEFILGYRINNYWEEDLFEW